MMAHACIKTVDFRSIGLPASMHKVTTRSCPTLRERCTKRLPLTLSQLLQLILFAVVISYAGGVTNVQLVCPDSIFHVPAGHPAVPCLVVPQCNTGRTAEFKDFTAIPNGTIGDGKTSVKVCHSLNINQPQQTLTSLNESFLKLTWTLEGAVSKLSLNKSLTACDTQVWMHDAAEFYVAPLSVGGRFDPINYTEIDTGPVGGLWLGRVFNPTGYNPASHFLPACNTSGIKSTSVVRGGGGGGGLQGWEVHMEVPLQFIVNTTTDIVSMTTTRVPEMIAFRVNLYRYRGSPGDADRQLSAWAPTQCDGRQCNLNHVPKYFGGMVLS